MNKNMKIKKELEKISFISHGKRMFLISVWNNYWKNLK